MKSIVTPIIMVFVLLSLSACQSTKPKADFNKATNFQQLKTFSLQDQSDTYSVANPIAYNRIKTAVKNQLISQGYTFIDKDVTPQGDVMVTVRFTQKEKQNNSSISFGFGGSSFGGNSATGVSLGTTIPVESAADLVTTFFVDMKTKEAAIWHGQYEFEEGKNFTSEQRDELVRLSVADLLALYPPSTQK